MLGMIENLFEQFHSALKEQAELDIQKESRNTALVSDPLLSECTDILRAYVVEPTKPNLPRAAKGYLKANQVKTAQEIQAFKYEVLNHLDSLKSRAQYFSLFNFYQLGLFNETVDKIKTALEDPRSEAVEFLRHRKRQLVVDRSASRMASFLLVYYLIEQINSTQHAATALNAITSFDRISAFGNSDLYINFILPIKRLLQTVHSLYKKRDEKTDEIMRHTQDTIHNIKGTFESEFIKEAKAAKHDFRRKAVLPEDIKQLFSAYETEHQREQQLMDQIKTLDDEYRSLKQNQDTSNNRAALKQKLDEKAPVKQEMLRTQDHKETLVKRIKASNKDLNPQAKHTFNCLYKLTFDNLQLFDCITIIESTYGAAYSQITFNRALEACQTVMPQNLRVIRLYSDQNVITGVNVKLASHATTVTPFGQNMNYLASPAQAEAAQANISI